MTSNNSSFSTAIITGATGFLGRSLVSRLLQKGIRVLTLGRQDWKQEGVLHFRGDITDKKTVLSLPEIFWEKPDSTILFHLAGLNNVSQCEKDSSAALQVNLIGFVNILEACRQRGVHRLFFPSTSLVYETKADHPVSETDPIQPTTTYAVSKLAAELFLQTSSLHHDFSCDVLRLSNVYGKGVSEDTVISTLFRQVISKEAIKLKTLKPIRDFIYIEDVVDAFIHLAQLAPQKGVRIFNLATGQPTSILELSQLISKIANHNGEIHELGENSAVPYLVLSIEKLTRYTGWRPAWSLEKGLTAIWKQWNEANLVKKL